MNGKGDKKRPGNDDKFRSNYDRIFGSTEDDPSEDIEAFHLKNAKHLIEKSLEWEEKNKNESKSKSNK